MPKNTSLKRLEDVVRERDTVSHTLNGIKIRYLKSDHDLHAVKTEKRPLIKTFSVIHAEKTVARAKRDSLQGLIEDRAESSSRKNKREICIVLPAFKFQLKRLLDQFEISPENGTTGNAGAWYG